MDLKDRVVRIIEILERDYPKASCSLDYLADYQLLISARLSAQCTDKRVNIITPKLFARYPDLESIAGAGQDELEEIIRSCGFFRTKAKDIIGAAHMLIEDFGGRLPDTMEELLKLPGVGRKTANLLLGDLFGKPAVVADTHCIRISNRLGLCNSKTPEKVEMQLKAIVPPAEQSMFCHRLVEHGREVCLARKPRCGSCNLAPYCDFFNKEG